MPLVSGDELSAPEVHPECSAALDVVGPLRVAKGQRFLIIVALLVLVPCGFWAKTGWTRFQTSRFHSACQTARGQKDWRTERAVADRWVAWDPETPLGWWCAAEACQNLEDFEGMAQYLGKVPQSDPKSLLAYVEKANLEWTTLNRPLDAVRTSELVLKVDPEIVEIQSRLISFYAMNLQRVPMLKTIRHAMEHHAPSREAFVYYIMADMLYFTNGADLNSRWLASSPDEPRFKIGLGVHTAMALAMNVNTTRTEQSVELDREADLQLDFFLEKNPDDVVLLTYMMHRAYQAGNTERVGKMLESLSTDVVDDHMIWVYRAWYHSSFQEHAAAEEAIREAIRLHPTSPLAHHEYANLLRKAGRLDEVAAQQQLASTGRELRTRLLTVPNAAAVDAKSLIDIAIYMRDCGDQMAYDSLSERLRSFGYSADASSGPPTP